MMSDKSKNLFETDERYFMIDRTKFNNSIFHWGDNDRVDSNGNVNSVIDSPLESSHPFYISLLNYWKGMKLFLNTTQIIMPTKTWILTVYHYDDNDAALDIGHTLREYLKEFDITTHFVTISCTKNQHHSGIFRDDGDAKYICKVVLYCTSLEKNYASLPSNNHIKEWQTYSSSSNFSNVADNTKIV